MKPVFSPPAAVLHVMNRLIGNGHDAWLVGGCIRDMLLGRLPADWDICTAAYPQTVLTLFPTGLDTGAKHGTVTVLLPGDEFDSAGMPVQMEPSDPVLQKPRTGLHRFSVEVTTWRSESRYSDHRHPDAVIFSTSIEADLSRRDFTINAMAWNPEKGILDLFNGQEDLAGKRVRCVGDPMLRFQEDALRMLRAIRFCSQLGFAPDRDVLDAIRRNKDAISFISRERTQYEMTRTLLGKCPGMASLWWKTGLVDSLFSQIGAMPADPGPVLAKMDQPLMNAAMDETILPWAVFWTACGLGNQIGAISQWMHGNKFPRKRANGIRKLLRIEAGGVPATLRNLRLTALTEGTPWLEASLRLRLITGRIAVPDISVLGIPEPEMDGEGLMAAIAPEEPPHGREFGALMECIRMVVCEDPGCNNAELLVIFSKIIVSHFKSKRAYE